MLLAATRLLGDGMAGTFNYRALAAVADKLILQFGMAASLRPVGATDSSQDRPCTIVITEYDPHDAATQLTNPTDRKILIAPGLGAVPGQPPDNEKDQIVVLIGPDAGRVLPFTSPVKLYSPAGITVLYESTVRR